MNDTLKPSILARLRRTPLLPLPAPAPGVTLPPAQKPAGAPTTVPQTDVPVS